jgi:hypothetical protein
MPKPEYLYLEFIVAVAEVEGINQCMGIGQYEVERPTE